MPAPLRIGDTVSYKTLSCKIIGVTDADDLILKDEEGDLYNDIKRTDVELLIRTSNRKGPYGGKSGIPSESITVMPHLLANVPELQNLTALERRFIVEYMKNPVSKLGAYLAAGGKNTTINAARSAASQLFDRPKVQTALKILNEVAGEAARWTPDKLHKEINRNYEIAMAAVPVIDKKTGKPSGLYQINHNVAYKYIELQARMLGVLKDKVELTGKDGAPLQVQHQHSVEILSQEHFERLTPEERILFYNLYRKAKGINDQPIIDGRPQPITENANANNQDHAQQDQTHPEQRDSTQGQKAIPDADPQGPGGEPESH